MRWPFDLGHFLLATYCLIRGWSLCCSEFDANRISNRGRNFHWFFQMKSIKKIRSRNTLSSVLSSSVQVFKIKTHALHKSLLVFGANRSAFSTKDMCYFTSIHKKIPEHYFFVEHVFLFYISLTLLFSQQTLNLAEAQSQLIDWSIFLLQIFYFLREDKRI